VRTGSGLFTDSSTSPDAGPTPSAVRTAKPSRNARVYSGTSPKPVIMGESIKRAFSRTTLSNLVWFAVLVAVGFAVGSTTARSDKAATCPPCYSAQLTDENFDNVTPPALPTGWLATNTLGAPPLWVTSNSGVPSPPADTPPNSAPY